MLLRFRNTYKTKKIMLVYGAICIFSFTLFALDIMLITIFKFWWLYLIAFVLFFASCFSFFLLELVNNGYSFKYYFDKKGFQNVYEQLIEKYKVDDKKYKKKIENFAKDLFYQYGKIYENDNELKILIFDCWLEKQSKVNKDNLVKENEIDFFLYILLAGIWNKNAYKIYLRNLANIYSRDELEIMIDNCICIKDSFKEKCLFIYDSPDFISDVLLNNMYFELILIIQCVIGILSNEEFEELMYNPNYYYREDKKIAYTIIEENELFKVYENNLELEYCSELVKECKSKEEAIKVIEDIKGDGINEY